MSEHENTCWTLIEGASTGRDADIQRFVESYGPIVRAYLSARWKGSPLAANVDDAAQEVFIECFREGGMLARASSGRVESFRAFLLGAVRFISIRFEKQKRSRDDRERPVETGFEAEDPAGDDKRLSRVFDRAWAQSIVREAATRHAERARIMGQDAQRRLEILQLHFNEGMRIKDVSEKFGMPLKATHHAFDKARKEFEESLGDVIRYHQPGEHLSIEKEIERLLELL